MPSRPQSERGLMNHEWRLDQLEDAVKRLQQRRFVGGVSGGGGEATRLHWCRVPTGGVPAATGTWPSLEAATFEADVHRGDGTGLTLAAEAATVYWRYLDAADEGKLVPCVPNGDGTYEAILDSCTAIPEDF